jgi:hypothetical protein
VTVSSAVGEGSAFELTLPTPAPADARPALAAGSADQADPPLLAETEGESIRR